LLKALDLTPDQVTPWTEAAPQAAARNRLVSLAFRPAPVTHHWWQEGPYLTELDRATEDITWLEAPNQRVEAKAIALQLRHAAELGQTAAVITPDRNLTRRIATALATWNITPDDSAGIPLNLTSAHPFWRRPWSTPTQHSRARALSTPPWSGLPNTTGPIKMG